VARNINKQGENENSQMQWLAKGAERLETAFHRNCCGSMDVQQASISGGKIIENFFWMKKRVCRNGCKQIHCISLG